MKKWNKALLSLTLSVGGSLFLYDQNTRLSVSSYTIRNKCIPKCFDNFLIAHISDIHNFRSKRLTDSLLFKLKEASPDIIVISGDLFDYTKGGGTYAVSLCKKLSKIANCYIVSGNHDKISDLSKELINTGVILLDNTTAYIERDDNCLSLSGISDTKNSFLLESRLGTEVNRIKSGVVYSMLLIHRPEYIGMYSDYGFDLVFAGHAHGGQIRLPFVGGLFAPNQGILPKYTSGLYHHDKCIMSLSRGLGNSSFPFRINNRPELTLITLNS